ncbi:hypothetical protein DFO66_103388 [Brevibacterium sanguinis]|uniref:Uncharacterized protein n=2 Tax=Brevibacterium TaxID=1696 RepID=A0A366IN27_9MICO|nr:MULTISPECIES: hypothetical protein [Brevibacterium]RBP66438.1 hypothetical protein DFO66_103388 [Brevibacterium sanguinis]RBP73090.1 hypothetical protein DFO65_103388 [Brevibacterium celere]
MPKTPEETHDKGTLVVTPTVAENRSAQPEKVHSSRRFVLRKGDHTITTTIPSEAYQLQAHGYTEEK